MPVVGELADPARACRPSDARGLRAAADQRRAVDTQRRPVDRAGAGAGADRARVSLEEVQRAPLPIDEDVAPSIALRSIAVVIVLLAAISLIAAGIIGTGTAHAASGAYTVNPLVSDAAATPAPLTDASLVNGWGLSAGLTAGRSPLSVPTAPASARSTRGSRSPTIACTRPTSTTVASTSSTRPSS